MMTLADTVLTAVVAVVLVTTVPVAVVLVATILDATILDATIFVATIFVATILDATILDATVFVATILVMTATRVHASIELRLAEYHDPVSGIRTLLSGNRTDKMIVQSCRGRARNVLRLVSDEVTTLGACLERQPVARARSPCGALESRTGVTTPAQEPVPTVASQMKASY
jgi:hypothetical protein